MWSWLITRPEAEADALVASLATRGVPARALPCVERSTATLKAWERPGAGLVFLTSAAAVEVTVRSLSQLSSPSSPHFAALKPATERALASHGQHAVVTATGGSVALAQATAAWAATRNERCSVLYPTSDLESDEQRAAIRLLEGVGDVTRVVAYQVGAPDELPSALAQVRSPQGLFFSSPSAVKHFFQSVPPHFPAPTTVACFGQSTLNLALELLPVGWPTPTLLPRDAEIPLSLEALWKKAGDPHGQRVP